MSFKGSGRSADERIGDILSAIEEIDIFIAGYTFEQFTVDSKTFKAVAYHLQVIGETATHLPDSLLQRFPEIPWRGVRGMRNIIVHEYYRLQVERLWNAVREHLPRLKHVLEAARSDDTQRVLGGDQTPACPTMVDFSTKSRS